MASSKNVLDVNDLNFETEVLQSQVPVLVDFSAVWCQPCKALAPIVDQVADEHVGTYKVTKVDIDESPATARRFGIHTFIHPSRNSADVAELPADVRAQMTFVPATTLDDVLKVALPSQPA